MLLCLSRFDRGLPISLDTDYRSHPLLLDQYNLGDSTFSLPESRSWGTPLHAWVLLWPATMYHYFFFWAITYDLISKVLKFTRAWCRGGRHQGAYAVLTVGHSRYARNVIR